MEIGNVSYLGNVNRQDIDDGNYMKVYIYTSVQKREVILFYVFKNEKLTIKRIAICSEVTETILKYWFFACNFTPPSANIDEVKYIMLDIIENDILPKIQYCQENRLPLNDENLDLSDLMYL